MNGFYTMLKMNFRLLSRNAGYLCFLIILPLTAVVILNFDLQNTAVNGADAQGIIYLEKEEERIEDMTGLMLNVKVYDYAASELSGYFLRSLQRSGSCQLYCYNSGRSEELGLTVKIGQKAVKENAIKVMNENTIGAVLVIQPDFDRLIMDGDYIDSIFVYYGNEDARVDALQNNINQIFAGINTFSAAAEERRDDFEELISKSDKESFRVRTENVHSSDERGLASEQLNYVATIKYSWALVTMAFTFSGVFVSHIVIMERNNGVFRRTKLSGIGMSNYGLVKFCMIIATVMIQVAVMGAGIKLFVKADFGIGMSQYLLLTFGLALILNTLSVVIGIIVNNLLSTSYMAFFAATMTLMISGLFFPMEAKGWLGKAALLTPQRWGVEAVKMLLAEEKGTYGFYALAVIAFLSVIFCVGFLGLNMIQKEEL